MQRVEAGFTLLELLITLAVITVLGMIAITSYSQYTIRANRTDAKVAIAEIAQKEERYFSAHNNYVYGEAAARQFRGGEATKILSDKALYQISVEKDGNGYLISATPVANKAPDVRDKKCRKFTLDHTGKEKAVDDAGTDRTAECWGR